MGRTVIPLFGANRVCNLTQIAHEYGKQSKRPFRTAFKTVRTAKGLQYDAVVMPVDIRLSDKGNPLPTKRRGF